jgi:hypothetical protein
MKFLRAWAIIRRDKVSLPDSDGFFKRGEFVRDRYAGEQGQMGISAAHEVVGQRSPRVDISFRQAPEGLDLRDWITKSYFMGHFVFKGIIIIQ